MGRRGKGSIVPTVHTINAQEESVTLEEIDSATSLVKNLETIELPNQLVAVLADPLLQKLLLLRPSEEAFMRVENWLIACVLGAANDDTDREELMDLVEVVHDYIMSTKVGGIPRLQARQDTTILTARRLSFRFFFGSSTRFSRNGMAKQRNS